MTNGTTSDRADDDPLHHGADAPGATLSMENNPGGVSIDRLVAELPPAIATLGMAARWEVVAVAANGGTVWRLARPSEPLIYLKVAPGAAGAADRLRGEAERLRWLAVLGLGSLAMPSVVASATDAETGDHYLALTEVSGVPADRAEARGDADALIGALAAGMRAVHGLPTGPDRFGSSIDELLAVAAQRVADGLVDPRRFEPIHARYRPDELYQHLMTIRPPGPEDRVVVHGNPRLDNTLVADGRVSGYVDLGRSGIADRYLDLAVVSRELATRVSPHALGPFFDAYGVDAPDMRKLDFFLLLDEFL